MKICKVCGQQESRRHYINMANGEQVCITCYSWWVGVVQNRIADLLKLSR